MGRNRWGLEVGSVMAARIPNAWPSLEPGQLRHRIQIQSQTSTSDGYGQPQATWSTLLTTWSRISVIKQNEVFQADQFTSKVSHTITMRFPNTITVTPGMRAVFGSHIYLIQALNNIDERGLILQMLVLAINESQ